jgi:hypothetical protein
MDIRLSWQDLMPPLQASGLEVWLYFFFYFFVLLLFVAGVVGWFLLPFTLLRNRTLLRELLAEARRTNALLEEAIRTPAAPHLEPTLGPLEPTLDGGRQGTCPNCEALIPLASLKCPRCGAHLDQQGARPIKPLQRSAT